MCEVDFAARRTGGLDQAHLLAQLTGFRAFRCETYACPPAAPGVAELFCDCRYGLCWLARPDLRLQAQEPLWLPNPAEEGAAVSERRALFPLTLTRPQGPPLWLGLTHLDHRRRATRLEQLAMIRAALPETPWLLCGDFNEPTALAANPDAALLAALAHAHDWPSPCDESWPARYLQQDAASPKAHVPGYPLPSPQAAIDQVFAGSGAHLTRLDPFASAGVSDHDWLLAEL